MTARGGSLAAPELTPDPLVPGGWLASTAVSDDTSVRANGPRVSRSFSSTFGGVIYNLQLAADTRRTVVASIAGGRDEQTVLFSFRDASRNRFSCRPSSRRQSRDRQTSSSTVVTAQTACSSAARRRSDKIRTCSITLRSRPSGAGCRIEGWQPLLGDGVFQTFQSANAGLPEAQQRVHDVDHRPDERRADDVHARAPGTRCGRAATAAAAGGGTMPLPAYVTAAWLSPVDGALYATVSPEFVDTDERHWWGANCSPVGAPGRSGSALPAPAHCRARASSEATCA